MVRCRRGGRIRLGRQPPLLAGGVHSARERALLEIGDRSDLVRLRGGESGSGVCGLGDVSRRASGDDCRHQSLWTQDITRSYKGQRLRQPGVIECTSTR